MSKVQKCTALFLHNKNDVCKNIEASMEQNNLLPFKELIVLTMKETKPKHRSIQDWSFGQFQKIPLSG